MRPRILALLCCMLPAGCSDGPAKPAGQSATEKVNEESGPLVSRNPGAAAAGGMALLLEGPNALSRISAQGIADIWASNLDRSGFGSYEIVQVSARRIEVRLWGPRDPERARRALRSAYGNPIDIRVIQERAIAQPAR